MSKIGVTQVERVAHLAHIGLTAEEAAQMAVELAQIVGCVEQLQAVDIEGVAPTDQVTGLVDVWREDVAETSLISRAAMLSNAPAQQDGYIKVKRVLNG